MVAKTVALLRQLNQLTVRTATVCQGLFDDVSAVSDRVAVLTSRVKVAEGAATNLEHKRASGVRPSRELEYGGVWLDLWCTVSRAVHNAAKSHLCACVHACCCLHTGMVSHKISARQFPT